MNKRLLVTLGWFTAFIVTLIVSAKRPFTSFDKAVEMIMLATVTLLTVAIVVMGRRVRRMPVQSPPMWTAISYRAIALIAVGAAVVLLCVRFL
jgi:Mn2+/Fe2+ NRAMP family transporter